MNKKKITSIILSGAILMGGFQINTIHVMASEENKKDVYMSKSKYNKIGIVNVKTALNVRENPNTNSKVLLSLNKNDKVNIIEEINGWYKIKVGKVEGYVSSTFVKIHNTTVVNKNNEKSSEKNKDIVSKKVGIVNVRTALNVRENPNTNSKVLLNLNKDDKVNIIEEINGWYKIKVGKVEGYVSSAFVKIHNTTVVNKNNEKSSEKNKDIDSKKLGIVNVRTVLNVRENPNTNSKVLLSLNKDDKVNIIEEINGWYKIKVGKVEGYVSSTFVKIHNTTVVNSNNKASEKNKGVDSNKVGIVNVRTALNVRENPNINSKVLLSLNKNDKVNIIKGINGWYKIKVGNVEGYVSSTFVKVHNTTVLNSNNKASEKNKGVDSNKVGIVNVRTALNVRENPNTNSKVLLNLNKDDKVNIIEEINGWYKIKVGKIEGYVSSTFVKVHNTTVLNSNNKASEKNKGVDSNKVGIVNVRTILNVRENPNTNSKVLLSLNKNDKVSIMKDINGWYKIKVGKVEGYVSSTFVKVHNTTVLNSNNKASEKNKGVDSNKVGIVNVRTALNVRESYNKRSEVIDSLKKGTKVNILGQEGDWYKIKINNNNFGYVLKSFII